MRRSALLIYGPGTPEERFIPFADQVVIGRRKPGREESEGVVLLPDPAVSSRHCVISQDPDGRFMIRDMSRNGTRLRGRRLVPNVEVEVHPGDSIRIGAHEFLLETEERTLINLAGEDETTQHTQLVDSSTEVTILVGDIHGYTSLNQRFPAPEVFASVGRVFAELEKVVLECRGAIKEYQGDAIFAYWEADPDDPCGHARMACRAALALDARLQELAANERVWNLDVPLQMEWALTTGSVLLSSLGHDRPVGLAMIGDAVNYAFRLEKLAGPETGRILVCNHTEALCRPAFRFRVLGEFSVEGRSGSQPVYALEGPKNGVRDVFP